MFDWRRFLTGHHIEFRAESATDIAIRCPFCGGGDPSMHLSISLLGRGWRCWRNPMAHRGRARWRLIARLLNCDEARAREIAGEEAVVTPLDEDFRDEVTRRLGMDAPRRAQGARLHLLDAFKPMIKGGTLARPFWQYLYDRGYGKNDAAWLVENYELHYCTRGVYAYRIIIPVRDASGKLLTWTGRSIRPDATLRYRTLPLTARDDYDGPLALSAPGELLLGLNMLWKAANPRVLVVVEGPFDAFRITVLGHLKGIYGACLFGLNLSESQALLLDALCARFPRRGLLLDAEATLHAFRMLSNLAATRFERWSLPPGVKDPGELPMSAGQEFLGGLLAA